MSVKFSNNGKTTLSAGISNSDTSVPVTDASVLPSITGSEYFYVSLEDTSGNIEIVKVTGVSSNTLTVTRAQDGTTARAFTSGDKAENRLTAGSLTDIVGGISSDIVEKQFTSDSALQAGQPCALKSNGNVSSIGGGGTVAAATGNFLEVNAPGDANGGLKDIGRLNLAYDGDYGIMLGVDDGDGDKTFYQVFSLSGTTISAVGNSTIAQSHGSYYTDAIVYDSSLQKYVCAGRRNNSGSNLQSHAYYITLDSSGSATVSSAFESTPHASAIVYDPAMVSLGDGRQVLFSMDSSSELWAQVLTCNGTDITYSAPVIVDPNGRNRPFIVKKISGGKIIAVYNSDGFGSENTDDLMACVITPAATGTSLSVGTPFKIHGGAEGNDNFAADVSDNGKVLVFARPSYYSDGVVDNPQGKYRAYVTDVSGTSFGSVTMTDNLGDSRLGDVTWDTQLGKFVYTYRENVGSTYKLGRQLIDIGSNNSVTPSAELLFNSGAIEDSYVQTLGLGSGKYITAFMENQGSHSLRSGFLVARQESLTLPGAPVADYIGINKTAVAEAGTATVVLAGIAPSNASLVVGDDYWITNLGVFQNSDSGYQKVGKAISSSELILDPFGDLDTDTTYTAGTGLSLTGTEFANTAPDQTVSLTGSGATTISGTYPNFTITSTDTNDHASAGYLTSHQDISGKLNTSGGSLSGNLTVSYTGNSTNDAGVYVSNDASDWGIKVSKASGADYGLLVESNGNNALVARNSSGTEYFKVQASGSAQISGNTVWHSGNDGSGSGLDADTIDGSEPSELSVRESDRITGSAFATTGSPSSVLEYQQAASITDTKLAPNTDWHTSIRMGHSNPYSYYSNTLAMRMTGSGAGSIFTQLISNNSAQGWRQVWDSGNDGSGSGLDADTVDGVQASSFLRSDANDTATGTITFSAQPKFNAGINFGSSAVTLDENTSYLRIQTSSGYTDIGAANSTYSHFYTDRSQYYFNRRLTVDEGVVQSYNENLVLRRAMNSSYQMTLSTSGATFTHNVTAYSDSRLKEDVKPIENALDTVQKLEGVTYTRKDNQEKNIGFIAQQIEEACPELAERVVGEMDDDIKTKHVNYANMVALLVEAVKELKAEVDELKAAK